MAILYKRDLAGVDWEALRSTLLEDDFDDPIGALHRVEVVIRVSQRHQARGVG